MSDAPPAIVAECHAPTPSPPHGQPNSLQIRSQVSNVAEEPRLESLGTRGSSRPRSHAARPADQPARRRSSSSILGSAATERAYRGRAIAFRDFAEARVRSGPAVCRWPRDRQARSAIPPRALRISRLRRRAPRGRPHGPAQSREPREEHGEHGQPEHNHERPMRPVPSGCVRWGSLPPHVRGSPSSWGCMKQILAIEA